MKFCTDWLVEFCLKNDFVPEKLKTPAAEKRIRSAVQYDKCRAPDR